MPASESVTVGAAGVALEADVVVPDDARATVVFAHGSGSSRHSPRNRFVAGELQRGGMATVLADLLTAEEERIDMRTGSLRFDIGLLAARVTAVVDSLKGYGPLVGLPVGLFGASTGAAAALRAAADRSNDVGAVVSRGGRPDLAGDSLHRVRQPTLLIVGGNDDVVLRLNREAMAQLAGESHLAIIPGATHLFEESGALEQVAELARGWFADHLTGHGVES